MTRPVSLFRMSPMILSACGLEASSAFVASSCSIAALWNPLLSASVLTVPLGTTPSACSP
eukprot:CAMPEP_0175947258 /NCGR_PEP_ID=MMETSP0108-20121206/27784_1 /TAXON_ID=195067 ORGANISM="Goniomonas pacifica, Strain CCMP1869" /NCGR_SAMPLE_ID=MMETSP0108 /ASSEMBLY_ACC=CAM_ASM_000204 /LENGTH=59 /DNA_ID=CAMNT_0017272865 /DNA_START=165 /DNA_END=341 /DNA_ORIENTATION=+